MKFFKSTACAVLMLFAVVGMAQQPISSSINSPQSRLTETNRDMQIIVKAISLDMLDLDEKEAEQFTGIYNRYVQDYIAIQQKREKLVDEAAEEIAEEDSMNDKQDEVADFIENYWETKIATEELKKDYFDELEDVIGPMRALKFFEVLNMYEDRDASRSMTRIPAMISLAPVRISYQPDLDQFYTWKMRNVDQRMNQSKDLKKIDIEGKVALDHEFTYEGLNKLLTATESMVRAENLTISNFSERKSKIMALAKDMTTNWKETTHADSAREAFILTADLMKEASRALGYEQDAWLMKLEENARAISGAQRYTDQADEAYAFFDSAERVLNRLVEHANEVSMR